MKSGVIGSYQENVQEINNYYMGAISLQNVSVLPNVINKVVFNSNGSEVVPAQIIWIIFAEGQDNNYSPQTIDTNTMQLTDTSGNIVPLSAVFVQNLYVNTASLPLGFVFNNTNIPIASQPSGNNYIVQIAFPSDLSISSGYGSNLSVELNDGGSYTSASSPVSPVSFSFISFNYIGGAG